MPSLLMPSLLILLLASVSWANPTVVLRPGERIQVATTQVVCADQSNRSACAIVEGPTYYDLVDMRGVTLKREGLFFNIVSDLRTRLQSQECTGGFVCQVAEHVTGFSLYMGNVRSITTPTRDYVDQYLLDLKSIGACR